MTWLSPKGQLCHLKVIGSFSGLGANVKGWNCAFNWHHMRIGWQSLVTQSGRRDNLSFFFGDKWRGYWKGGKGLVEHPNRRPMARKLNQSGRRGQRKWPQGQWTPPRSRRKGSVTVLFTAALTTDLTYICWQPHLLNAAENQHRISPFVQMSK